MFVVQNNSFSLIYYGVSCVVDGSCNYAHVTVHLFFEQNET